MLTFERIDLDSAFSQTPAALGEVNIFQTAPWVKFVAETQNAEPVLALVRSGSQVVGTFTGLISRKYGIRILGSPFRGWMTYFMGFNLLPEIPYREVMRAFPAFAFKEMKCAYLEVVDPNLAPASLEGMPYKAEDLNWFGLDLTLSEDELLANMKSSGRNCIRKSIKNGVTIEESTEAGFADEYYAQHKEVLAHHGVLPTYSLETLRKMVEALLPTGSLLLLRAKNPDGLSIATGIFLGLNKTAVFWGAASLKEHQSLRPNEPLAWYGIQKMKARGVQRLHFGGTSEQYKEKLGCTSANLFRFMKIRYSIFNPLLDLVLMPKNSQYKNWVLRRLTPRPVEE